MELITNNPFRVAGVLSNASARELARQKAKISAYANIGREVNSEFDFESLGNISRSDTELVENAFSSIEQNHNRVNHALFWFLNVNAFDNTAIEYLKAGNTEKATDIWEKVTEGRDINSKNFSSFNNLGTLKLLSEDKDDIKGGIEAKVKLIESDLFKDFVHTVADETYVIAKDKQIELFIDALLVHLNNEYSREETIELFENCNGSAQSYLVKKFADDPIYKIEKQIENSKETRKDHQNDIYHPGLDLYNNNKDDLSFLKKILGIDDLKYIMIADRLANEITQCGIDHFNNKKDSTDPSRESLMLLRYAAYIAVGSQIKDRIKDNKEGIEEWTKIKIIDSDIKAIVNLYNTTNEDDVKYPSLRNALNKTGSGRIPEAKRLIENAIPHLINVKTVLKENDESYINLSTSIVSKAQGYIIETINSSQLPSDLYSEIFSSLIKDLKIRFTEAWKVTMLIGSLDMSIGFRKSYNENKRTLKNICTQFGVNTPTYNFKNIPQLNFIITGSEIINTDRHSTPLLLTEPLYDKFVRFIGLKLNLISFEKQKVEFFFKYIDSKGNVSRNTKSSPVGYTKTSSMDINSDSIAISTSGWGATNECIYEVGKHSIEVWVEGFMIHKKEFRVDLSPSQKIEAEIKQAEIKLKEIKDTTYFSSEIRAAHNELVVINKFKFLRFGEEKRRQVENQNKKINELKTRSKNKQNEEIVKQNAEIVNLKKEVLKAKY